MGAVMEHTATGGQCSSRLSPIDSVSFVVRVSYLLIVCPLYHIFNSPPSLSLSLLDYFPFPSHSLIACRFAHLQPSFLSGLSYQYK